MNTRFLVRVTLYLVLLVGALYVYFSTRPSKDTTIYVPISVVYTPDTAYIKEALDFCDSLGYSTEFAILIDLTQHSGNYRFFAYNLETQDTIIKGLVAHGHCKSTDHRLAQFSNEIGSNCSSLGRYKVGGKYQGEFGTSYKLHGLDSSNSNALDRYVVLHSHACIPLEAEEDDICLSEGCPTVNPKVLEQLEPYLDNTNKPILLWIYENQPTLLQSEMLQ